MSAKLIGGADGTNQKMKTKAISQTDKTAMKVMSNKLTSILTLGIGGRQLLASVLICLLLAPVFSLPARTMSTVSYASGSGAAAGNFAPVNAELSLWETARYEVSAKIEEWLNPYRELNRSNIISATADNTGTEREPNANPSADNKAVTESDEYAAADVVETPVETNTSPVNSAPEAEKTGIENAPEASEKKNAKTSAPVPAPRFVYQLPGNERNSIYDYENNLGAPAGQVEMDSPNQAAAMPIHHRAGVANFSFGVPLASLPGRGIDAGVGLTYNSRAWNKSDGYDTATQTVVPHFTYDVEESWIAPGFSSGFGYLETQVAPTYSGTTFTGYKTFPVGLTDPSGTRHELVCIFSYNICSQYETTDGSFIRFSGAVTGQNPENAVFTASYPNGSKIYYFGGRGTGEYRKHYAAILQDNNGNRVRIAYKDDTSGRIDYISDTLNRQIKFYYVNNSAGVPELSAVTVPAQDGTNELQTVRFYYGNLTLDLTGAFTGGAQVTAPTASIRVLKYVFLPGTHVGYKYDYHSKYGMITKITRFAGMAVNNITTAVVAANDTSLTTAGAVTYEGAFAASTEYAYQSGALDDVPKYTSRTDDWAGRTASSPAVTDYNSPDPGNPGTGDRESTVIVHNDLSFNVEYTTHSYNTDDWHNGLTREMIVTQVPASGLPIELSKTKYFWDPYGTQGRENPRLTKIEVTDEAGLTKATEYQYDQYNNQTQIKEHGYAAPGALGSTLRTTDIGYEDNGNWINNNLLGLVKSVAVTVGTAVVSKTLYEYDQYQIQPDGKVAPKEYSDMDATHDRNYNPSYPASSETVCPRVGVGDAPPNGCVYIQHDGWTAATNYRGNVTKVGRMLDPTATSATETNSDMSLYTYDIVGNTISATLSCCQLKTFEYGENIGVTGYAYPVKITKGGGPQLTSEISYNRPTGQVIQTKDENNLLTNYEYEADTLRQSKTTYPNGGETQTIYSDKFFASQPSLQVPSFVYTVTTLDTNKTAQSYSYFDGRGSNIRNATLTPDGWLVAATVYDQLGRPKASYNPFYAAAATDTVPVGTKYTQVTSYDGFGRATQVQLQDGTSVKTEFNPQKPTNFNFNFVTVTDQTNKQRRQVTDALGRIIRVDEPDKTTGTLTAVNAPTDATATYYEYDGNDNLSKVTQADGTTTQERVFKYDPLSRLTNERQVEANATLDDSGVKGAIAASKWTKVLKYTPKGLLTDGYDARGVNTHFTYDGLNRAQSASFSDGTPTVTYTYDQVRTGYFNQGALTKIETAAGGTNRPDTPATATELDYDKMGSVVSQRQSIGSQTYTLGYAYNLAGQLKSETYPSGKTINVSYDANGRMASVGDQNRTYASGFQYLGQSGSLSGFHLGNGTSEAFTYNERLQMTQQSLSKPGEVIQRYDYGYGQINASGNLDTTKNNGQLGRIESYIGSAKQWTQKFAYDGIGRLSQAEEYRGDTNALSYKQKFDYDRFGNLYRKAANNPATGQQNPLAYTPIEDSDISKSTNRFTTNTSYDDAGNVTQDTKFRNLNYSYDANGRMFKTSNTANTNGSNAVYDASGNRVAQQIDGGWTYFIYDVSGKLVSEYGGQPIYDEGGIKYVYQDWQGSTRAVMGAGGAVLARSDYTAFGEEIGANVGQRTTTQGFNTNNTLNQKYALTERDKATGLDHTWFRKNENRGGRWTSPDPYNGSMSISNPQSFNRYSYVSNQPINFVDPSGLFELVVHKHAPYNDSWNHFDAGFGGDFSWLYDGIESFEEFLGADPDPDPETCTLTVNITKVGTSGSSSGSSSGTAGAQSGPYNHLYVTTQYSNGTYTSYAQGFRAGVGGYGIPGVSNILAESGIYVKGFRDYEENPSAAVVETFNGTCEYLDEAFQKYVDKVNNKGITYTLIGTNSNAFIYSMLNAAGIHADSYTPSLNDALGWTGILPGWGNTLPLYK